MYARSRGVPAPIFFAFATAAAPLFNAAPLGGSHKGCQSAIAVPQWAMAQLGSAWAAASKRAVAEAYANEWRSASAVLNSFCAAALQDVGKCRLPSFPSGASPKAGVRPNPRATASTSVTRRMRSLLFVAAGHLVKFPGREIRPRHRRRRRGGRAVAG